jgi:hypothetical protein
MRQGAPYRRDHAPMICLLCCVKLWRDTWTPGRSPAAGSSRARLYSHGGERPPVVVRIDFASRPDAMPSSRPELRRLAPPLRGRRDSTGCRVACRLHMAPGISIAGCATARLSRRRAAVHLHGWLSRAEWRLPSLYPLGLRPLQARSAVTPHQSSGLVHRVCGVESGEREKLVNVHAVL